MPVKRTSQDWDQSTTTQQNDNENNNLWRRELQLSDNEGEGIFLSNDEYLREYHDALQQVLSQETYSEAHNLESRVAETHPNFVPTSLPTDVMETEFLSLGQPPIEDDADELSSWEEEPSTQVQELQHGGPVASTSNRAAGLGKKRTKELSGECAYCGEAFSRKSDAKRHENSVHRREKFRFRCSLCATKCSRKDALERHIKKKHPS